jgi:NAD(P) transhydrogenase subunit beta
MSDFQALFQNDLVIESLYMLSAVFFILSLGGLSNPESSKRGNLYGMYGMLLAVGATLFTDSIDPSSLIKFGAALLIGALIGIRKAITVEMIAMPQLVAELHSFVGLAATIVGYGSYFKYAGHEDSAHQVEMYIGIFIGVITFVGSIVAWAKLDGKIGSEPLIIGGPMRHVINAVLIILTIILGSYFVSTGELKYVLIMTVIALFLGWHLV